MSDQLKLTHPYRAAGCCSPSAADPIVGYYSHDSSIRVHRESCPSLANLEPERLIRLEWSEIVAEAGFSPGPDYDGLEAPDFAILRHHREYDIDYSAKVARMLNLDKADLFSRHRRLREMGLLERVEATMVRYRRGVVDNKWIKHRNHTYYRLTERGRKYLAYHENPPDHPSS